MEENNKVIVVLSAGRSGTSLLMNMLGRFGMTLSEKMIPGRLENPEGYFEDVEIVDVHRALFKDLDALPTIPLPDDWLSNRCTGTARRRLVDIIQQRVASAGNGIWGFKDPRTAHFLPLWNKVFNLTRTIPLYILAVRHPASVAVSLKRQENRDELITELQWLQRTTDALHHTAGDCFILHYEDWFQRPEELAHDLLDYTGLADRVPGEVSRLIKDTLKPNLNRSVFEDYAVQNPQVAALYDVLSQSRGTAFDREAVMETVLEARKTMAGYKGWYIRAGQLIRENTALSSRLETARDSIDGANERANALAEALDHGKGQLQKAREREKELVRKAGEQEKKLVRKVETLEKEMTQLTELNNDCLKKNQQLSEMVSDLKINNVNLKQFEQVKRDLETVRARRDKQDQELKQVRKNLKTFQRKFRNTDERYNIIQSSTSFQLGSLVVNAVKKPGLNTLLLPFRLIKLLF